MTAEDAWERWLDAPSDDQATNQALADAIAAEVSTPTSAERIRAYLDHRYQNYPELPTWIDGTRECALTVVDLEVVLQMNDLLARLLAARP